MIKLDSNKLGGVTEVTGNPVDVSMFFVVWQQAIWPEFFRHKAETTKDDLVRQMRDVNQSIKDGKSVYLASGQEPFTNATTNAVEFCRQFMEIEWV